MDFLVISIVETTNMFMFNIENMVQDSGKDIFLNCYLYILKAVSSNFILKPILSPEMETIFIETIFLRFFKIRGHKPTPTNV